MYNIKYLDGSTKKFETLQGANLQRANLRWANLRWADLQGADLEEANLRWADLQGADLQGADLQGADLQGANLQGANLQNIKANYLTQGYFPVLNKGNIEAYKKINGFIVTLRIPEDAKRSNATTRKCRVSKAKVISIVHPGTKESKASITSTPFNGKTLTYVINEMVYPDSFDENRWNECSNGIYCFATVEEALTW